MDKVWAISHGDYSDYSVCGVALSKEVAERWVKAMNGTREAYCDEYRIEELTVYPDAEPVQYAWWRGSIELWDNGEMTRRQLWGGAEWPGVSWDVPPGVRPRVRFVRAPRYNDRGGRLEVYAATAEQVAKVLTDRVAAWKAGSWITRDIKDETWED